MFGPLNILGYPIIVFTDHAPVTELFKGRNLTGRLPRWYLTIQDFGPTFKYLPGHANVVADSLSRTVPVGSVAEMPSQIENFTLQDLAAAQRQHDIWSKVIFALESGDETSPPRLLVSFSQFFLFPDRFLCRYWPSKKEPVAKLVVPECYVPAVLNLVHDTVVAGHPGRERTLAAARAVYFWPTMNVDTGAYVNNNNNNSFISPVAYTKEKRTKKTQTSLTLETTVE